MQAKVHGSLPGPEARRLIQREARFCTGAQDRLYPLFSKHIEGALVEDVDGNRYVDFSAGSGSIPLGVGHPEILETVHQEAGRLGHPMFPYSHEIVTTFSERLTQITPGGFEKMTGYSVSGGEAVESAFKLARWHTKRQLAISFFGNHTGNLGMGAVSLSGHYTAQKAGFHPVVPGVIHVPCPYSYRCPLGVGESDCGDACLDYLEETVMTTIAPPEEIACVVVEPIQGPGSMAAPTDGFHPRLKKLCERHGILLIDDEIVSGLGRTGKMFAIEHWGVEPDVVTLGKSLGGGVFPVGAFVGRKELFDWPTGSNSSTFAAHPLGCAIALKVIEIIQRDRLADRAEKLGRHISKRCHEMMDRHELIGDVRMKGLMGGVELVKDRETKEPAVKETLLVAFRALQNGLILQYDGLKFNVFKFYPTLTIGEEQIDEGLDIFEKAIGEVEKGAVNLPDLPDQYLLRQPYK